MLTEKTLGPHQHQPRRNAGATLVVKSTLQSCRPARPGAPRAASPRGLSREPTFLSPRHRGLKGHYQAASPRLAHESHAASGSHRSSASDASQVFYTTGGRSSGSASVRSPSLSLTNSSSALRSGAASARGAAALQPLAEQPQLLQQRNTCAVRGPRPTRPESPSSTGKLEAARRTSKLDGWLVEERLVAPAAAAVVAAVNAKGGVLGRAVWEAREPQGVSVSEGGASAAQLEREEVAAATAEADYGGAGVAEDAGANRSPGAETAYGAAPQVATSPLERVAPPFGLSRLPPRSTLDNSTLDPSGMPSSPVNSSSGASSSSDAHKYSDPADGEGRRSGAEGAVGKAAVPRLVLRAKEPVQPAGLSLDLSRVPPAAAAAVPTLGLKENDTLREKALIVPSLGLSGSGSSAGEKASTPLQQALKLDMTALSEASGGAVKPARPAWEFDLSEITLGQRIGAGAFGEVYEGSWRRSRIAVKRLLCQRLTDSARREFMDEMQVCTWQAVNPSDYPCDRLKPP